MSKMNGSFHADLLHRACFGEAWHGSSVMENLKGVDAATAAAKPIPGAHSIWELVIHLAAWNREFAKLLRGGKATLQVNSAEDWPAAPKPTKAAWDRALRELRASVAALERVMATVADEDVGKTMPGRKYKIGFALSGLPHHLTYHGGQIAVLKKAVRKM